MRCAIQLPAEFAPPIGDAFLPYFLLNDSAVTQGGVVT